MEAGRELDALIAEKVFGRSFEPYAKILTSFPAKSIPETPFYSTDIAAAWEVVEKMNSTMPETWTFSLFGSGNDWHVEIDSNDGRFLQNGATTHVFARSESAPHAICLAALKAVGVEI